MARSALMRLLPLTSVCVLLAAGCGTPPSTGSPDGGSSSGGDAGTKSYTWYRDVLPLVQESCQGCHTGGGIGPFALETYAQAEAMHAAMAAAVASKRMPPWMPDPSCNSYKDERRLTQEEIDVFVGWSAQGAPEGDPKDAPASPPAPKTLAWVDAELDAKVDYIPQPASGSDDYHCFVLDPNLTTAKDVIGFDIVPGVRSQVHHVLLYSADKANAQAKDDASPDVPGWTCFGGPGTQSPAVVGGWVPGTPITEYPANTGIRLAAGKVLVMQVHYNVSQGTPQPDRTVVKLQYSKQPVARQAQIVAQTEAGFAIPPGAMGYSTTDTSNALPLSVVVYGVLPHMHTLGRKIKVTLTPGDTCVVDIPSWDFHWQQFYMLQTPITIPAGSQSVLTCTWDNPTSNTVTWGDGTADEMCLNYAYVTLP